MPRRARLLTVKEVATFAADEGKRAARAEMRDGSVPGLTFRLSPGGAAWWLMRRGYKSILIGRWPATGLADARKAAQATMAALEGERASAGSFKSTPAQLAERYYATRSCRSEYESVNAMANVFRKVWRKPVSDLTSEALQKIIDAHPAKSTAALATRCLRPILKFAARRKEAPAGLWDLEPPRYKRVRDRVLSSKELRTIWPHLTGKYGRACRIILYCMARREEVCAASVGDFDLKEGLWMIPSGRMKNDSWHAIALPTQVVEMLTPLLKGRNRKLPALGKFGNWDRWQKRINKITKTSGWHRHDLRRTSATIAGELGIEPHLVELMLGHIDAHSSLASVYNKSRYLKPRREALQKVADRIDEITSGGNNEHG